MWVILKLENNPKGLQSGGGGDRFTGQREEYSLD